MSRWVFTVSTLNTARVPDCFDCGHPVGSSWYVCLGRVICTRCYDLHEDLRDDD